KAQHRLSVRADGAFDDPQASGKMAAGRVAHAPLCQCAGWGGWQSLRAGAVGLPRMNLIAAMRYLVALDKHRHFGRAAEACHVSQPALSNALRALEEEFGVAIVKRSRTYGGLTPEGEVVLATARRTLRDIDLLTQEMRGPDAAPRGPLRIG